MLQLHLISSNSGLGLYKIAVFESSLPFSPHNINQIILWRIPLPPRLSIRLNHVPSILLPLLLILNILFKTFKR